jgi:hypothetical protein
MIITTTIIAIIAIIMSSSSGSCEAQLRATHAPVVLSQHRLQRNKG